MAQPAGLTFWRKSGSLALAVLLLAALAAAVTLRRATPTWEDVLWLVRKRYPDVRQTSVAELAAWMADSKKPPPLLLDVRTFEEFEISHLPGAIRVDPGSTEPPLPPDTTLDTPIVTYCSVGQRSSAIAQRLQDQGYTHVANLEGSIFAWANAGYPMVRNGEETHEVHPYSARWGHFLHQKLRATIP